MGEHDEPLVRVVADLKAELAESKAAANRVTESMGSEILRLQAELEQQRTRAEAAEQELREAIKNSDGVQKVAAVAAGEAARDGIKLAAIRAHLAGVDVEALARGEERRSSCESTIEKAQWCDNYKDAARAHDEIAKVSAALRAAAPRLIAAAREALEP